MPRERTLNIDEPMDLTIAQFLMKNNPRNYIIPLMEYEEAVKKLNNIEKLIYFNFSFAIMFPQFVNF